MKEPVSHHCKPDGVFKIIFIRSKSLCRVEGRVYINELHVTHVLLGKLWHSCQGLKNVAGFAVDEQVVSLGLKIGIFGILVFI